MSKMKIKHVNIPVFVPHKGCPNDCSFCNQRKITGLTEPMTAKRADEIIKEHLETIDRNVSEIEVAFFGGSFSGIPVNEQEELLKVANSYLKKGLIDGIRLSTRPDYISDEILSRFKEYGVTAIELGAQSMINDVLLANDRGHSAQDTKKASLMIKDYGFSLGLQMMTGLYKDDREGAIYSAKEIISLKPDCVRIYPTLIIKDTKLHQLYEEGKYVPMELYETAKLCAELLELFDEANIKVLRVGLLGTDNINNDGDVVAGPFHQSMGELAESERFFAKACREIDLLDVENINIKVNPRYISIAVGQKKRNITRFKEKYQNANVKITQDENVPWGIFKINF